MRSVISLLLAAGVVAALAGTAAAGEKAGVKMPDTVDVAGKSLKLNGMGLREATMLNIDVYVAGLYLETVSSDPAVILKPGQVKRLVLRFVRDVDRDDILEAWTDGFKGNAPVKLATIQAGINQLNGWMKDFKDGDRLTFTDVPTEGLTVDINGTKKGTIAGDDFARSLFAIWLGPKPPTSDLKKGMLGKH